MIRKNRIDKTKKKNKKQRKKAYFLFRRFDICQVFFGKILRMKVYFYICWILIEDVFDLMKRRIKEEKSFIFDNFQEDLCLIIVFFIFHSYLLIKIDCFYHSY